MEELAKILLMECHIAEEEEKEEKEEEGRKEGSERERGKGGR